MKERDEDQLLSVKRIAARTDSPPSTVRDWLRRGLLPYHKLPGRKGKLLVRESDLAAFLARIRVEGIDEILRRVE